jgi:hypothetical protein
MLSVEQCLDEDEAQVNSKNANNNRPLAQPSTRVYYAYADCETDMAKWIKAIQPYLTQSSSDSTGSPLASISNDDEPSIISSADDGTTQVVAAADSLTDKSVSQEDSESSNPTLDAPNPSFDIGSPPPPPEDAILHHHSPTSPLPEPPLPDASSSRPPSPSSTRSKLPSLEKKMMELDEIMKKVNDGSANVEETRLAHDLLRMCFAMLSKEVQAVKVTNDVSALGR